MTKEEIEKILRSHNDREGFYIEECAEELFKNITPATPLPDDEEIMEYTETALAEATLEYETGFISGAKWMREKCSSLLKAQEQRHEQEIFAAIKWTTNQNTHTVIEVLSDEQLLNKYKSDKPNPPTN
ncbi:MAG: hypothetical protein A2W17_06705 [Planctomycetes bacterium RBG_16_41_13]|nr:MAG: hypothetical protein A2W17_06705 [Planctomycetes bacterium RBG_16_41_13]